MTKATGSTSQETEQSSQELNTETITDPNVKTAILENPIKRGDIQITEIQIRKPNVGTLRNLSLQDVLKWEINAVNTVLTRVTQPALNVAELNAMDVSDYTTLTVELTSFLVSAKAKSQATLMTS
ncbi:phage tail assembly protein [Acinetobacter sp. 1207_04]|uniref:phage tail assembly protein n=1 Tax=Acinetobacter sp. 1207_04 TaxID=2604449 RepID=UPI004058D4F8